MALFKAHHITKRFGGLVAVKDLSFEVEEGEIFGIIGPNGAGKTTLFNIVSGIIRPDSGRLEFRGADITSLPPHQRCCMGMGRTFQLMQPFDGMTVAENVMVGILFGCARPNSTRDARRRADEILEFTGLAQKASDSVTDLTTADLKRLEIARALGASPRLLLLDEVIGGLTPSETAEAVKLISQIVSAGTTVLMIEHVMTAVRDLCNRVLVMHYGEKLAEGTYREVAARREVIEAYLGEEENHG